MPEQDILAWAASHAGSDDGLAEAFATLAREGLFHRVLYPVFAVPAYYCSYDDRFLDELPENIGDWIPGTTIPTLKESWEAEFLESSDEFAETWIYWGLCNGQGSQSGSSGQGPCLGPSCSWFTDGNERCNWGLPFADVPRDGWPNMRFLHILADERLSEESLTQALRAWRVRSPQLPWPPEE